METPVFSGDAPCPLALHTPSQGDLVIKSVLAELQKQLRAEPPEGCLEQLPRMACPGTGSQLGGGGFRRSLSNPGSGITPRPPADQALPDVTTNWMSHLFLP